MVLCVVGAGLVANAQPAASAYSSVPGALAAINPRVRFKYIFIIIFLVFLLIFTWNGLFNEEALHLSQRRVLTGC